MDEMKISTKFMQSILSKIVKKALSKKLGVEPEISFGAPIDVKFDGDIAQIHVDVTVSMLNDDISKLLKDII